MTTEKIADKLSMMRFLLDQEDAVSADSVAYIHAVLSQIGLPRSPQSTRTWERSNGDAYLAILAGGITGEDGKRKEVPLPQGPYARLILADISTFAVQNNTRVVPMEDSAGAYMRHRLKLFPGGGKRGTYTSFKREAQALAAAHMELSVRYGNKRRHSKAPPIESFDAWMVDDGAQQPLWPCELLLSQQFYDSLRTHAAPVDMRAYRGLAHSALAQDIYTWMAHRLHRLRSPLELPWSVLADQFGGYRSTKQFRDEFVRRLPEVRVAYQDAKFEIVRGRKGQQRGGTLRLLPSPPPVPRVAGVVPGAIGAPLELGEPIQPKALRRPKPRR